MMTVSAEDDGHDFGRSRLHFPEAVPLSSALVGAAQQPEFKVSERTSGPLCWA